VSRFETHSFDCNGHLNELVHTLEWPDVPIKLIGRASASGRHWFALLTTRPDVLLELTGCHSVSVRSILVSYHSRPDASGRSWPDPPPRSIDLACFVVSLGLDRTRRSHDRPDAPVWSPSIPCHSAAATDRTRPVILRPRPVQCPVTPVTSVRLCFYPRWLRENLHLRHSGK
jgi:hypothetical protein